MGQARELLDTVTASVFITRDIKAVAECYAPDAIAVTPDEGELRGRDAIAEYHRELIDAFPDARYDYIARHESGDCAIDEGVIAGTHTAPLSVQGGPPVAPTGRQIRLHAADVCTVADGLIVSHRFYFDQLEFLSQLGLVPTSSAGR